MTRKERLAAYRSLIIGVQELQEAWPKLPEFEGSINDLCGFLFATLPLSEAAYLDDVAEVTATERRNS